MTLRRPVPVLLLAALVAPTAVGAQSAADTAGPEPVIVELSVGRYGSRTVSAYRSSIDALLPVLQLAEVAELRTVLLSGGAVEITLEPGRHKVILDPSVREIQTRDGTLALTTEDRIVRLDEQYLSTSVLSRLLGVRFDVNWSELAVTLLDPDSLPVGRRIARERAHALFQRSGNEGEADLALGMERIRWDGVVLDYSLLAPSQDFLGSGAYSAGLGMHLFGGSLEGRLASAGPLRDGDVRVDASWTGVWRRSRYVTQLRLGDGLATGPRPRTVRGFSISNAPFLRSSLFGAIGFQGALGPGWEIEAYRGGRLIAFDSADAMGRFSLDLPVEYGENAMDFVAYGPFGEIRRFNQNYRVSGDVIPDRKVEYGLAVGACRTPQCRASANLDLRYGLSSRWTVRGGVDQFWRDSLPGLFHPYVGVGGSLGNAWGVELEGVAAAVVRGALRYEPSQDLRLTTEYHDFAAGTEAPLLTAPGRRTQWTTDGLVRPFRARDDVYLEASTDRITADMGTMTSARLGLSFYASRFRVAPGVRHLRVAGRDGTTTQSFASLNTFSLPFPELGPVFGRVLTRTNWEIDDGGRMALAGGYLSREMGDHLEVEAGVTWTRGLGTSITMFVSTRLPSLRATTSVMARPTGDPSVSQFVQGSVLYDPDRRQVAFASGPSLERAGISGRVFLDLNGDRRWQAGEQTLHGVRVRAGFATAVSDSSGRYRIWDLPAFEPVLVAVDTSTLASPLWAPAYNAVSVETGPNRFRTLDIAVVPTGVIEGRVVRQTVDSTVAVAGARLLLRRQGSSQTTSLVTFSDGGFYLIGVKPGAYELSADPAVLTRLGLTATPVAFTVPTAPEGATVDGLELRME
ncbi:MAG TPA: carboxypeptidase-like regulatory domain-containing protein [Gemmatimonadales bacterium]|nr:carboxypeptidase-like regulatory domain-containing protein [Gemmatimonadales bacterium]